MTETNGLLTGYTHVTHLKLAREIAMDMRNLEEILKTHGITQPEWDDICTQPAFQRLLRGEVEAWESATNTAERVKLKSLAFVEEALPEFFARAHDTKELLSAKVEVLKTISKFAGVGQSVDNTNLGDKLTVTINLGSDQSLKIEKDITPKVINYEED